MAIVKGFIFDLDGVLVDTARFHFKAWKKLAEDLGIKFSEKDNEQLKGVSRRDSLKMILEWGNASVSDEEFEKLMHQKNEWYLELVDGMKEDETLPGVKDFLEKCKQLKLKMALGSASKNARAIIEKTGISGYFDAVVDGTQTERGKPDPQVFEMAAEKLRLPPESLVVFEDAQAGIAAANSGGFKSVGIGKKKVLKEAMLVFPALNELKPAEIINQLYFSNK